LLFKVENNHGRDVNFKLEGQGKEGGKARAFAIWPEGGGTGRSKKKQCVHRDKKRFMQFVAGCMGKPDVKLLCARRGLAMEKELLSDNNPSYRNI